MPNSSNTQKPATQTQTGAKQTPSTSQAAAKGAGAKKGGKK